LNSGKNLTFRREKSGYITGLMKGLLERIFLNRLEHENTGLESVSVFQKKTTISNIMMTPTFRHIAQQISSFFPLRQLSK
jgi:hypothetical protein